jgi:hypothetical protein
MGPIWRLRVEFLYSKALVVAMKLAFETSFGSNRKAYASHFKWGIFCGQPDPVNQSKALYFDII